MAQERQDARAARRSGLRSQVALPDDATDEQRFARDWLKSRLPVDPKLAPVEQDEWEACMEAGTCDVIEDNMLSVSLNLAWKEEEARLEVSRIEAEYARQRAIEKEQRRLEVLAVRKRESDKLRGPALEKGVALLKEMQVHLTEHKLDDVDFSDDEAELINDFRQPEKKGDPLLSEAAARAKIQEREESLNVKLISKHLANKLHNAGSKPLKPLEEVRAEKAAAAGGGETDDDEERKGGSGAGSATKKGSKGGSTTTGSEGVGAEAMGRMTDLYTDTLAKIMARRKANPIEQKATYDAILAECKKRVMDPAHEGGFGGSALAAQWWEKYCNAAIYK